MEDEIRNFPPGILKLLSPPLANAFANLICTYGYRTERLKSLPLLAGELSCICKTVFRSVLTRYIEKLSSCCGSQKCVQDILVQILDSVPGLLELSVNTYFLGNHSDLLAGMIRHLKNLQIFKCRWSCTDEIIKQLQRHCPHLRQLDVASSREVTNSSVQYLIKARELQFLNLEGTEIDDEHYAMIISELLDIADITIPAQEPPPLFPELPKITGITIPAKGTSVFRNISAERFDTITHVRSYLEAIHTLTHKCPNITNLTMKRDARDLSGLTALKVLRVLEINGLHYSTRTSNFKTVLQGVGHRLTDLKLSGGTGVVLQDIITLCPSLAKLSLISCLFERVNTSLDPKLPHFRNLINLEIHNSADVHSDLSFIRYYVSLKIIDLGVIGTFTVDFVREILNLGTFKRLEIFHVEETCSGALNVDDVQLLIQRSPVLKRIEIVQRCRHYRRAVFRELKRQIVLQNLDLTLKREVLYPFDWCSADM
jgi:hypothetical protein